MTLMASFVALILLSSATTFIDCLENNESPVDVSEGVKLAMRIASRFLNTGKSEILSSVLSRLSRNLKKEDRGGGWLPVMLGLLGQTSESVQEMALNGLISVAHLISQVLTKEQRVRRRQRSQENFSPTDYLLKQPQVVRLLTLMQDPSIIDSLLREWSKDNEQDVDCVQLLVCKTTPFVRGMQKSLSFFSNRKEGTPEDEAWKRASMEERMYFFFPSMEEFVERGVECDAKYPNCFY